MNTSVRTRIAPSPTGEGLHIGNLYTGLINFAVARKHKGSFIIRIEDTDRERFIKGSEEKILASLKSFNLTHDEGPDNGGSYAPYRQSERLEVYQKYVKELVQKGHAYYCFCTKERLDEMRKMQAEKKQMPKYDRHCLTEATNSEERIKNGDKVVVRMRIPENREIVFNDIIHGEIKIKSDQLDDQVILKSDGYPTYHLGVVVDDYLMKITHVIRAEEWISSTPKHVLLYEAFGWDLPIFAHVPILRNPDRSKLSKRKNPVWASWYLKEGYLPEAMLNYLSLMGWSHPEEKEIFLLNEFIEVFELKDIKSVGPIFDLQKLSWMNGTYIRNMTDDELSEKLIQYDPSLSNLLESERGKTLISFAKTRMKTLKEFKELVSDPKDYSFSDDEKELGNVLYEELLSLSPWEKETILTSLKAFSVRANVSMKTVYLLLTGKKQGLPLPETLELFGKEESLKLLKQRIA